MTKNKTNIYGRPYDNESILKVGNSAAKKWNAKCVGFRVDEARDRVMFDCIEGNDEFSTSLRFDEVEYQIKKN